MGDDPDLLPALRRGDARAFDAVYARYHGRIFNFLARLCGRRDVAEDLFQETWLKLARHATRLREDSDVQAWLFTVARNQFMSQRRDAARAVAGVRALGVDAASSGDARESEEQAAARERVARLERALSSLPEASREVLLLVTIEGIEQERVARILGIAYDAVRQRLARARAELAARLEEGDGRVAAGGKP